MTLLWNSKHLQAFLSWLSWTLDMLARSARLPRLQVAPGVSSYTFGPSFLVPFIGQSSAHLLNDGILQNSLLGHFLFSFYICLVDLIYSHDFNYYLLLITSKSTFLFLECIVEFRDMTLRCVTCSLNLESWKLNHPTPPLWMASSITQFPQRYQFHLLTHSFSLSLVSSFISTHLHPHWGHHHILLGFSCS